ncbi:MAG: hypothetical protein L6R38_004790 [Xanthoria sp. 2 TBL-2021]|nr:MAG: hypothetical protein L6R38_004790 [Xanthoria sp. 2 TBL-2021]
MMVTVNGVAIQNRSSSGVAVRVPTQSSGTFDLGSLGTQPHAKLSAIRSLSRTPTCRLLKPSLWWRPQLLKASTIAPPKVPGPGDLLPKPDSLTTGRCSYQEQEQERILPANVPLSLNLDAVHSMVETRRLHVSPLDPELLPIVLAGPLRDLASNISYHTLQSLPDKRYGYLDLPVLEADRLQKKLHGSILKGVKMKVEKARPEKARTAEDTQDEETKQKDRKQSRRAKSAKQDGVLDGVELPDGRTVKRGWTEPGAKEEKQSTKRDKRENKAAVKKASAHTDAPECLFKTKIPRNARSLSIENTSEATKSKKRKRGQSERDVLVHEFDKTTKQATFFREDKDLDGKKSTSSYIEGKGWLDQDGNIIENMDEARQTRRKARQMVSAIEDSASAHDQSAKETKTRAGRSRKPGSADKFEPTSDGIPMLEGGGIVVPTEEQSPQLNQPAEGPSDDQTSSEGSDSSEGSNEVNTDQVRALSISRLSPTPPLEANSDVHPLEALFKRPQTAASQTPQKPSLEVKTGFSFFEPDEEPAGNTVVAIPQTPFTQQDFQERRFRSAAPTPDTAAPGKTSFGRLWSQGSGERDSESDEEREDITSTPRASNTPTKDEPEEEAEESEFAKWFYEHRGETNRAWKRRRREAAKEGRQKDNKRR